MNAARRVQQQPAFLLHYRPFRDSSLLLDVFSHDHGKLALVARGARASKSRLKGVLRPFMPLLVSWVSRADLGTLTGAELNGQPVTLRNNSLMSGYYVNELILHFLHRHDPQPEVFKMYRETITLLAAAQNPTPALRVFEMELLSLLGYALNLTHDAVADAAITDESNYEYRVEQGPVSVSRDSGPMIFSGAMLAAIRAQHFEDPRVLKSAGRLLKNVIAFHLGGKELKSRKVLLELHKSRDRISSRD